MLYTEFEKERTMNEQEQKAIIGICILAAIADGLQGEAERTQIQNRHVVEMDGIDGIAARRSSPLRSRRKTRCGHVLHLVLARTKYDERLLITATCLFHAVHIRVIRRHEGDIGSEIRRFKTLGLLRDRSEDKRRIARARAYAGTFVECQNHVRDYSRSTLPVHRPSSRGGADSAMKCGRALDPTGRKRTLWISIRTHPRAADSMKGGFGGR